METGKSFWLWFVDLAIPSLWGFGALMVGEKAFGAAEWLFIVGNLVLAVRIVFGSEIERGQKTAIITFTFLCCAGLSWWEWDFVEGRRAVTFAALQSESVQTTAIPAPSGSGASFVSSTPAGALTKGKTPSPAPRLASKPQIKPTKDKSAAATKPKSSDKPAPSVLYPIILASASSVVLKSDAHELSIGVTFANTTSTEANGHITLEIFLYVNGTEIGHGPVVERDYGFGPPPMNYDLSMNIGTPLDFETLFPTGGASATVIASVSYPDRGGETIYHFKGNTTSKSNILDMSETSWEQVPPK